MKPASSRRLLLALALSLVVHALVWLVLAARARDPLEKWPAPPAPITLQYVEVEVAPPPPKPPEPPPPPPPTPKPPRAPPKPVVEAPPPTPPPPEATAETSPPPPTDVPRADAPVVLDAPRVDGPRLTPQISLTPGGGVAVPPTTGGVPGGLPTQSPQQIVDNLALETMGKGKVERGLVHPYFTQLGKSLLKSWDAERAVTAQGVTGFLEQKIENSRAWNAIWREPEPP